MSDPAKEVVPETTVADLQNVVRLLTGVGPKPTTIDDHALATLLVERLNAILETDREALSELMLLRVHVGPDLADQTCCAVDGQQGDEHYLLGVVGLLNGLCGSAVLGRYQRIFACLDQADDGSVVVSHFEAHNTPPPHR